MKLRRILALLLGVCLLLGLFAGCKTGAGGNGATDSRASRTTGAADAESRAETDPPETGKADEGPSEPETPTEKAATTETPTEEPAETVTPSTEAPAETEIPTEEPADTEIPTEEPTETESPTETPTEEPAEAPRLSWQKAFRSNKLPEGWVTPDCIAFYQVDEEGGVSIHNVPKEEVFAWQPERLPRTHYYEKDMSDPVREELLPILDYALAHGYCRCSIPSTTLRRGLLLEASNFLRETYRINDGGVGAMDVQSFPLENGETLVFLLVTLAGMDGRGMMRQYLEGIAAAEAVVDSVPAGSDELQTALYLYKYLTDNVRYYYDDYYGSSSVNFLYDALVNHKTVCAGYTEALYYLYNLAGIDCFAIEGYVISIGSTYSGGAHIWNIARINGSYYQFDSTWDEGLPAAEYQYFGVSDAYMMEHHTEDVAAWHLEHCPACESSLFPEIDDSVWDSDEGRAVAWYYRFQNAVIDDPLRILFFFGSDAPEDWITGTEDGWVKTDLLAEEFLNLLGYAMDEDLAEALFDRYCRRDGVCLSYPAKEETPELYRLCGLQQQEDGTWLASLYVYGPDGSFTPLEQTLTLTEQDGRYRVKSAE